MKITFKNSIGLNLSGDLTKKSINENTIVVLFHGLGSSKNSEFHKEICHILANSNIANFVFDFSAHGESEGEFKNFTVSQAIDDAYSAISFLKQKGYKNFIIIGSSFGGYISTILGAKEKGIKKIILRAPVLDYFKLIKLRIKDFSEKKLKKFKKNGYFYYQKQRKIYWKFYQDILKNKYDAKKGILKCKIPIVVIHGDSDKIVPFSLSENICSKITNCKLIKIKGGNHRLNSENIRPKVIKIIVEEIKKTFFNE